MILRPVTFFGGESARKICVNDLSSRLEEKLQEITRNFNTAETAKTLSQASNQPHLTNAKSYHMIIWSCDRSHNLLTTVTLWPMRQESCLLDIYRERHLPSTAIADPLWRPLWSDTFSSVLTELKVAANHTILKRCDSRPFLKAMKATLKHYIQLTVVSARSDRIPF